MTPEGLRESALWAAATAWVILIYSTLYYVRAPVEYLRERNLLRLAVAAVFLLAAATVLFVLLKRRPSRRELIVFAVFVVLYILAVARIDSPEEKLHFVEYGVLAALVYGALLAGCKRRARRAMRRFATEPWWAAPLAVLLTGALGWVDEGIQAVLPNRMYDTRDVLLNIGAGLLAVAVMFALRRSRVGGSLLA